MCLLPFLVPWAPRVGYLSPSSLHRHADRRQPFRKPGRLRKLWRDDKLPRPVDMAILSFFFYFFTCEPVRKFLRARKLGWDNDLPGRVDIAVLATQPYRRQPLREWTWIILKLGLDDDPSRLVNIARLAALFRKYPGQSLRKPPCIIKLG